MKMSSVATCFALGVAVIGAGSVLQSNKPKDHAPLLVAALSSESAETATHLAGYTKKEVMGEGESSAVARLIAGMLARNHYIKQPIDEKVSSKFLDKYIDTLDPQHIYFLESDLTDFEVWRKDWIY